MISVVKLYLFLIFGLYVELHNLSDKEKMKLFGWLYFHFSRKHSILETDNYFFRSNTTSVAL